MEQEEEVVEVVDFFGVCVRSSLSFLIFPCFLYVEGVTKRKYRENVNYRKDCRDSCVKGDFSVLFFSEHLVFLSKITAHYRESKFKTMLYVVVVEVYQYFYLLWIDRYQKH